MPRHKSEETLEDSLTDAGGEVSEEQAKEFESEAKDKERAYLKEEIARLSKVVSQLAKKESIPTGEAVQEYYAGEFMVPFMPDGRRIAEWKAVGSFEEPIGDAMQRHFTYDITFEKPNGEIEVEKAVPHRRFKDYLALATRTPVSAERYLRRIRQGDHYVYQSVRALSGKPYEPSEDIEVTMGRLLADGRTKMYDGEKKTVKFYTLNAL